MNQPSTRQNGHIRSKMAISSNQSQTKEGPGGSHRSPSPGPSLQEGPGGSHHSSLSILIHFHPFSSIFDQFNQFLIFPILDVRVLLLRNIIAAKPMVQFGFPKHQKVYQGHKMVPCKFWTRTHSAPDSAQLTHSTLKK